MRYRIKQVGAGTFYVQSKWMGIWWTHREWRGRPVPREFVGLASAEMFIECLEEQNKYPIYHEYRG